MQTVKHFLFLFWCGLCLASSSTTSDIDLLSATTSFTSRNAAAAKSTFGNIARLWLTSAAPSAKAKSNSLPDNDSESETPTGRSSTQSGTVFTTTASNIESSSGISMSSQSLSSASLPSSSMPSTSSRERNSLLTLRTSRSSSSPNTTTEASSFSNTASSISAIGSSSVPTTVNMTSPATATSASITMSPTALSTRHTTDPIATTTTSGPTSTSLTTATAASEPRNCLPGSQCGWQLGLGLSFGSVLVVAGFCVVGRRYRRFLSASQRAYRESRDKHRHTNDAEYGFEGDGRDMRMTDMQGLPMALTQYNKNDELFLPDHELSLSDNNGQKKSPVTESQWHDLRLPVERYGTVMRKSLAGYRDF